VNQPLESIIYSGINTVFEDYREADVTPKATDEMFSFLEKLLIKAGEYQSVLMV
jgi:hypothetical protein